MSTHIITINRACLPLLAAALVSRTTAFAQEPHSIVQVGPNVQVSAADAHRSHYEVQVCADPKHAGSLMAVSMTLTPRDRYVTQVYTSSDDGRTWHVAFEENPALNSFDPSCAYGRNNQLFFLTIGFPGDESRTDTSLLRSTDNGQTWKRMAALPRSVDRPYLTVDRSGGLRDGHLYIHGKRDRRTLDPKPEYLEHLWIGRTADGGQTFSHLDVPSLAEIYNGSAAVLADGTFVTVLGKIYDDVRDPRNAVEAVRSSDGASSIEKPVKIADWHVPESPNHGVGFTTAAGEGRHVFATWEDGRSASTQIMFSASADGGATWTRPMNVTSGEGRNRGGFNPAMAVNRSGVVGLLWYDKRDHPADLGWGVRFTASLDQGKTFQASVRISEKDAVPGKGLAREGGRFTANGGDTSGLDAEPDGAFRAVWIDNRTGIPQIWTTRLAVPSR